MILEGLQNFEGVGTPSPPRYATGCLDCKVCTLYNISLCMKKINLKKVTIIICFASHCFVSHFKDEKHSPLLIQFLDG